MPRVPGADVLVRGTDRELVDLVLGVATGTVTKADIAVFLRDHSQPDTR